MENFRHSALRGPKDTECITMPFLGRAGTSLEKGPQEEDSGMAQRALETQPLSSSSEQWA